MRTRTATPADAAAADSLVERAYARYVERIGRRPGPMDDDHAAEIAAGELPLLEDDEKMTENIAMYERAGWTEYDRRGEAGFARVFFRKLSTRR